MINVATVGVHIHKAPKPRVAVRVFWERSSTLSNKASPTARHSTSTEKMAALFVSVSFVNISRTLSLAEVLLARRSCRVAGSWSGSDPRSLGGGQVAVLCLHAASLAPCNEGIILLSRKIVCTTEHKEQTRTSENTPSRDCLETPRRT